MPLIERRTPGPARCWLLQLLLISGLAACGGADGPPAPQAPPTTGTVTGTVRNSAGGAPIAGATVAIGARSTTSGTDGGFQLDGVTTGTSRLNCSMSGFEEYSENVTVATGVNTHDVTLSVRETYMVGSHVIYVPARATTIRGVIVAIGGPDTRCWADPRLSCAMPSLDHPDLISRLQQTGSSYRMLAASLGLAVLGGRMGTEDVIDALSVAAVVTQRPELATAPFLVHGMSGGGPAAYRLVMGNPGRAAGLILRVAAPFPPADPGPARSLPALLIIAGADDPQLNSFNRGVYSAHRDAGGLWAFAEEPGAPHLSLSTSAQDLYLAWIASVLEQRLPATPGGQLRTIDEESGWLGNLATFDIASWADYGGERSMAAWLPSEVAATRWRTVARP
jgi:hypothetical protein